MTVAGRVRQVVAIYRSKTKEISWWDQRQVALDRKSLYTGGRKDRFHCN